MTNFSKRFQTARKAVNEPLQNLELAVEHSLQDHALPFEQKLEIEELYHEIKDSFYNLNSLDASEHLENIASERETPLHEIKNTFEELTAGDDIMYPEYHAGIESADKLYTLAKRLRTSYNANN